MDDSVESARKQVTRKVMGIDGVVGTAIGLKGDRPCIKVYLEKDDARLRRRLPRSAGGVPVDVEVTGGMQRW